MSIAEKMRLRFTSGNSIPVERAWLTATEWAELCTEIQRLRSGLAEALDAASNPGADEGGTFGYIESVCEAALNPPAIRLPANEEEQRNG